MHRDTHRHTDTADKSYNTLNPPTKTDAMHTIGDATGDPEERGDTDTNMLHKAT